MLCWEGHRMEDKDPAAFLMFQANLRTGNLPLVTLKQKVHWGGWHGLCFSQPQTLQIHPQPLQSSGQPRQGWAVSTGTWESLLPQHHQNFRKTMETPLHISSCKWCCSQHTFPDAPMRAEPSTRHEKCPRFLQPLSPWLGNVTPVAFGH